MSFTWKSEKAPLTILAADELAMLGWSKSGEEVNKHNI